MAKAKKYVKISENGKRIGEDHHRAKLTDAEVDKIRELYETGLFSYRKLAREFGTNRSTIQMICRYERRNTHVAGHKMVHINE